MRYSSGKTDLCPHLPLKGLFYLHEELRHSAPGLPDAELILKKFPPVGKPFLLINTPFVLLIYLDLKQNSPWCKTKVREFTTDHRTVRVIRAHNLISPAPSLQESFFFLWKEPLHSAPGLPDAGLILKKTQPVAGGKLISFLGRERHGKSLARRNRGREESADPSAFFHAEGITERASLRRRRNLHILKKVWASVHSCYLAGKILSACKQIK